LGLPTCDTKIAQLGTPELRCHSRLHRTYKETPDARDKREHDG
jgi:hypothetical protein